MKKTWLWTSTSKNIILAQEYEHAEVLKQFVTTQIGNLIIVLRLMNLSKVSFRTRLFFSVKH